MQNLLTLTIIKRYTTGFKKGLDIRGKMTLPAEEKVNYERDFAVGNKGKDIAGFRDQFIITQATWA